MSVLQEAYPYYLNNKAVYANENLEVTEDTYYTGYVDKKGKKCAYGQ